MTWVNSDHYVYFKIQRLIPTLNFHTGFVKDGLNNSPQTMANGY